MNKKFILLVTAAGLVSALLLFAGTALMDRLAPVYASRLPALLAGGSSSSASDSLKAKDNQGASISIQLPSNDSGSSTGTPEASVSATADSSDTPEPMTTFSPQSTIIPANPQGPIVTIAELAANPAQYRGMLVSVSGIATDLDGDKFLLNDGTGQIIVDLEDDLVKITVTNGGQVTVLGQFKVRDDGIEVDACVFNDGSGNVQVDGCENEHPNGDDKGGSNDNSDDSSGSTSGSDDTSDDNSGSDGGSDDTSDDNSGSEDDSDDNSGSDSDSDDASDDNSGSNND